MSETDRRGSGERGTRNTTGRKAGAPMPSESSLYRQLIEQIPDYAIFCTDVEGRPTTWNRGVERILGYSEREFLGRTVLREIFTPEDIAAGVPEWETEEAVRNGTASNNRWMSRKNGGRFYAMGMTMPLHDDRGLLIGFAKIMQDRTVQRQQAEALRDKSAELEAASEQKDRFLAVLSHELRNPLAPIRSGIEVLQLAEQGSDMANRAIAAIDRQSRHLTHLVDDLLDLTRVAQGKIKLRPEPLELNALAHEVSADFADMFASAGISFTLSPAGSDVPVYGDRVRFAQILGNLLENAAKFTPRGGHVRLAVERMQDRALLCIADDGVGMSADTLAGLFQPFMQAQATVEKSRGGLGLGLALVEGLVRAQGGTITAASEGEGLGSVFEIRWPLDSDERRSPPAQRSAQKIESQRILIVEDNGDAAETLGNALALRGHVIELAHTGPEGVEKAISFRPDVVLCDLDLPGLDGYSVAARLRAEAGARCPRLIALSGHALPADAERAAEAGFDAHVAKPPSMRALEDLLADAPRPAER
jgi:PAS domain S-box-containing protein